MPEFGHERARGRGHGNVRHRDMMFEQMAVAACAECIVVRKMLRDGVWLDRRAQRGIGLVRLMRGNQLTHERREHDEPHGDEAKPCGQQGVLA